MLVSETQGCASLQPRRHGYLVGWTHDSRPFSLRSSSPRRVSVTLVVRPGGPNLTAALASLREPPWVQGWGPPFFRAERSCSHAASSTRFSRGQPVKPSAPRSPGLRAGPNNNLGRSGGCPLGRLLRTTAPSRLNTCESPKVNPTWRNSPGPTSEGSSRSIPLRAMLTAELTQSGVLESRLSLSSTETRGMGIRGDERLSTLLSPFSIATGSPRRRVADQGPGVCIYYTPAELDENAVPKFAERGGGHRKLIEESAGGLEG